MPNIFTLGSIKPANEVCPLIAWRRAKSEDDSVIGLALVKGTSGDMERTSLLERSLGKGLKRWCALFQRTNGPASPALKTPPLTCEERPALTCLASWLEANADRIQDLAVPLSWYVSTYSDTIFGIRRARVVAQANMLKTIESIVPVAKVDAVLDALAYVSQGSRATGDQALAALCEALLQQSPGDCCRAKSLMERTVENRARIMAGI